MKPASIIYVILLLTGIFCNGRIMAQIKSSQYNTYKVVGYSISDNQVISESNTIEVAKKLNIHIPNAFSPDGDGINDLFTVKGEGIEDYRLEIYNRWGEILYQTNDIDSHWDGFHRGKLSQNDAYVYVLNVRGMDAIDVDTYRGTVSLIR